MSRKPIKPSKSARNQRKQEERKNQAYKETVQAQSQKLQRQVVKTNKALEQLREVGRASAHLVQGAMQAINKPRQV